MHKAPANALRYYVLPSRPTGDDYRSSASGGDGSSSRPFRSLDEALLAVGARHDGAWAEQTECPALELVCATDPPRAPSRGRPRYQFYVDASPVTVDGDGSEASPWRDWSVAVAGMARLRESGGLELADGQRIVLVRRQVFTSTALERVNARTERLAQVVFLIAAMLLVAPVLAILSLIVIRAMPVLSLDFILTNPKDYMTAGGIWAPLVGTFFLVLLSLLVAAPVGVLAGVYLNEYAGDNWFTRAVNLAVVNLAGVPSIVHALFGLGAFVLAAGFGASMLAASCTLAVMTLPVIITSTREALNAVPMAFREACWNMGASRWQTIRTLVLPNSIAGILTGVILQVSRAAGETAPIMFTGAAFYMPVPDHGFESLVPYGLFEKCMALSMHLYTLCTQVTNVRQEMQFGTAAVLIALVVVVNSAAITLRIYLRSRKKW